MTRVIFYHVGKGDLSLVLFPNGDAMMVDCYKADEAADAEIVGTDAVLDRVEAHILEHREILGRNDLLLAKDVSDERARRKDIPTIR